MSVDTNGLVAAHAYGDVVITATTIQGVTTCSIESRTISGIWLTRTVLNFTVGVASNTSITVKDISPAWAAGRIVEWTSDNPNVTISRNGSIGQLFDSSWNSY